MRQLYTEERLEAPIATDQLEEEESPAPLSKLNVFLLNIFFYGLSVMYLIMSVEVVPAQIIAMVGENSKGRWLGGMVAGGAVLTLICSPLIGMRSDRMVSNYGRRRPVIVAATITLCAGLWGMAFSAPNVSILRPKNSTAESCHVDLVAKRCRPFWNGSVPHPLPHAKGDITHHGSVVLPAEPRYLEERIGNIGVYIVFYLIVTSSFAAVTVPYNALIADKSHPQQRGLNSGVMGAMILLGNVSGAALGMFFMQMGVFPVYGCITGMVLVCMIIMVCTISEAPSKALHDPVDYKKVFMAFWEPLKEHNFRWVFFTRFLMQQGLSTVLGFLEYWLSDVIDLPNCWSPERSVAILLIPLLFSATLSSIICGIVSDKLGRRKPLVIVSALMMCVCTSILAFMRGEYAYYIATGLALVFGAGFGAFQAVDFALVMDVLPAEKDKAKDIAVWHLALILPQAFATPIGGVVLDIFESINCEVGLGYIILFLITAVYFFLSGAFVLKIHGVR